MSTVMDLVDVYSRITILGEQVNVEDEIVVGNLSHRFES